MRFKVHTAEKPIIDILIATAIKGGVENCINMTGRNLTEKGFRIRVIQLVYYDIEWVGPCMEFHYLNRGQEERKIQLFIDQYKEYLEKNEKPKLILATGWPLMCHIAKSVTSILDLDTIVASWPHGPISRYEEAGYGGFDYLQKADIHFAISKEIADSILSSNRDALIYRVNNPVDTSRIHKIESPGERTLLFVGRLSPEKNIPVILNALSQTKEEWNLRIVGDGKEMEALKSLSEKLGISERVEFLGWSDDPWKYAEGATSLVLSSYYEGSPLAAIEALSCGLPVIANVSSKVAEVIVPGENGYLYPDNDSANLAKILDMIATGAFAPISPDACISSVFTYKEEISLFDFYTKVFATVNGRIINDALYGKGTSTILHEKTTLIIPCYNAQEYIGRCLDSILGQTIGKDFIEIIAVNDASTDDTYSVLCKYEQLYPENIGVINLEENSGQGAARNIGLSYASGKYIMYVDADDYIYKGLIEKLFLIQHCYPVEVTACNFDTFREEASEPDENSFCDYVVDTIDNQDETRRLFLENAFLTAPWAKLYEKSFLLNNPDISFLEHVKMEDIYFTYPVLAHAGSWIYTSGKGYYYCMGSEGVMRSEKLKSYYMDVFYVFEKTMEQLKGLGYFDACKEEIAYVYYEKVFDQLRAYMKQNISPFPEENYKLIKDYLIEEFPDIEENKYLNQDERDEISKCLGE